MSGLHLKTAESGCQVPVLPWQRTDDATIFFNDKWVVTNESTDLNLRLY